MGTEGAEASQVGFTEEAGKTHGGRERKKDGTRGAVMHVNRGLNVAMSYMNRRLVENQ